MTPKEALERAISIVGSQTALARALTAATGDDIQTGHIYYWLTKAPEVPAKFCPAIERATREMGEAVYCEQLCPSADWAAVRNVSGPPVAA